jgi:FkbM family methyltransferase
MLNNRNLSNELKEKLKYITTLIKSCFFDFSATSNYLNCKIRDRLFSLSSDYSLVSKYSKYPLSCRQNTSDIDVFYQIFLVQEYACLKNISNVNWIIDCGANVGYSSVYFLNCFPESRIIAIEPDLNNFEILKKNLEPYKDRVTLIHSAIWSQNTGLKISDIPYGEKQEWSIQVRTCLPGETPDIEAVDLETVIKEAQIKKVSLLKMDIEGAEAVVFAENYQFWLPIIEKIVIEIHDNTEFGSASDVFFQAIRDRQFDISKSGELTICQ